MGVAREVKRWYKRLRSRYGRKNGVVYGGMFDNPNMERKMANTKHLKKIKKHQIMKELYE